MVNNSLGGLSFGIDTDGNYGYYKDGADTVTPFNSGCKVTGYIYSWANRMMLYDCPSSLKVSCESTVYLFNNDTGTLITSGTNISLTNNVASTIKIKAKNTFSDDSANGFSGISPVTVEY